jgi:hypothetical protein
VSVDPLGAPTLVAGASFEVPIPPTAFRNVRANAQVILNARQANGAPLPAWIRFDAGRNVLTGIAPAGVSQLAVQVTAIDDLGNRIASTILLRFAGNR